MQIRVDAREAAQAAESNLPVQVPDGRTGIAVEAKGEEVKVAFLDGDVRWFHHTFVWINV